MFFTPPALCAYVAGETLAGPLARCAWRPDGSPELRVLDPAAGSGRFLVAALDVLVRASARRSQPAPRHTLVSRCLVGIERDPAWADEARRTLGPGADIRVGDALLEDLAAPGAFDAIVANPPYVRACALKRDDPVRWGALRGRFHATSFGEWDVYGAFMERAADWLGPGGHAGLVVPSRWLVGEFAGPLRALLATRGIVTRVVDYGAHQLFADATTYTSLVFFAPRPPREPVRYERFTGHGADGAALPFPLPGQGAWRQTSWDPRALGSGPWRAPAAVRRPARGPTLAQVARVSKGAGTSADRVFLVPTETLEEDAAVACLRGRDVTAYRARTRTRAIFPYDDGGRLVPAHEMQSRWPGAWRWLLEHRARLEARENGRFTGARFHAWGRPQNLVWLCDPAPKIVVPDATLHARAALDESSRLVIDSAYAIRPRDGNDTQLLGLLLAVLNAPCVEPWLRGASVTLRGDYFRMKTAFLAALPLPDPATRAAREVSRMALGGGDPADIADRVAALYRGSRTEAT